MQWHVSYREDEYDGTGSKNTLAEMGGNRNAICLRTQDLQITFSTIVKAFASASIGRPWFLLIQRRPLATRPARIRPPPVPATGRVQHGHTTARSPLRRRAA